MGSAPPSFVTAFAPGRINLIGEHTDYNDGLALAFAISQGVNVTVTPAHDGQISARALNLGEQDRFAPEDLTPVTGWRAYVRGALAELGLQGLTVPPARLEISGDLPICAGLSSSAALEVALLMALLEFTGASSADPVWLAQLGQRIEHRWAGAQTGLLDQLASLTGRSGHATLIDFRGPTLTAVPLELCGHRLVILDSGVRHTHADSGYNLRRHECAQAAHRAGAEALRDVVIQDLHVLPEPLRGRAQHVITENDRVLQAVACLKRGDMEHLGRLLDLSHTSLRDQFSVSVPEVEETVDRLKAAGALGARMIGGGFGGSVLALMPPGASAPPGAIEVQPGPGARLLAGPDAQ
ncbi:MAG: galactokinase [Solirubrobacteraceae bacterium]